MARNHLAARRPPRLAPRSPGADAPARSPLWLLAREFRLSEVLPALHQYALDRTVGRCSLLFQHNPRNGELRATSGFALDELRTDPWEPDEEESQIVAGVFDRREPVLIHDARQRTPDLAARLGATSALLVPLVGRGERVGLLAIGLREEAPSELPDDVSEVGDAFLTALELFGLRQREELQRDVRALVEGFSATLSATLNLSAGLDAFCLDAARLFGADRASVWIHDRRARSLIVRASSDSARSARAMQVDADDASAPAAVALRRTRAEIVTLVGGDATATLTVPLRGTRRALGTMVWEAVRIPPGGELDLLDRADELGRQLAGAIENVQLLDDVIRSFRELENTFDSISNLVVVTDRRGQLTHVNQAFADRRGRTRDELIDEPLANHVGLELSSWIAHLESTSTARTETPASREILDPVLQGPFMVTVTDLVNPERERVGRVLVARELTPHTRLEAEREELRKRLTQTEKLAALGQFVAGIAHELNNPLQGVLGHMELLRVTGAFPKQIRKEVQTIYREADRAAKIVRNLLVFAGSRRLARRSVSVNAVLQKVLALRAAPCRALNIELVRHYDDKLPRVKSDPLLLHQVFLNMVMNAEHAIAASGGGSGGRIEITTSVTTARDRVVATVRDTGTGIAEDTLSRIFEPFYTTKEVGQGTGLGLAIAYGIVQEHGGQIMAANHPEGGAVFTVELPTTGPPARA